MCIMSDTNRKRSLYGIQMVRVASLASKLKIRMGSTVTYVISGRSGTFVFKAKDNKYTCLDIHLYCYLFYFFS